jgi:hypothetical protein
VGLRKNSRRNLTGCRGEAHQAWPTMRCASQFRRRVSTPICRAHFEMDQAANRVKLCERGPRIAGRVQRIAQLFPFSARRAIPVSRSYSGHLAQPFRYVSHTLPSPVATTRNTDLNSDSRDRQQWPSTRHESGDATGHTGRGPDGLAVRPHRSGQSQIVDSLTCKWYKPPLEGTRGPGSSRRTAAPRRFPPG